MSPLCTRGAEKSTSKGGLENKDFGKEQKGFGRLFTSANKIRAGAGWKSFSISPCYFRHFKEAVSFVQKVLAPDSPFPISKMHFFRPWQSLRAAVASRYFYCLPPRPKNFVLYRSYLFRKVGRGRKSYYTGQKGNFLCACEKVLWPNFPFMPRGKADFF